MAMLQMEDGEYTKIAEDQFMGYDFDENALPGKEYIQTLCTNTQLIEGINLRIQQLGFQGNIQDNPNDAIDFIVEHCEKAGVGPRDNEGLSRQTIKNWLDSGYANRGKTGRINIYKLCFALGFNVKQTKIFFFKHYLERPFDYKNIYEAVCYFCLNTGRCYEDVERLVTEMKENPADDTHPGEIITEQIGKELSSFKDEEKFMQYLSENRSYFVQTGRSSVKKVEERLEKCKKVATEYCKRFLPDEHHGEITSNDQLLSVIYGYAARKVEKGKKDYSQTISKSDFPKLIRENFPQRQQLQNISKGTASFDAIRKALIMLTFFYFFATAKIEQSCVGDAFNECDLFDNFVSEMNGILEECGYIRLYWRNPFDWMIGYCAYADHPLDELQALIDEFYLSNLSEEDS